MMIDAKTVTANAGDIILVNPYEVHSNLILDDSTATYHLIMLDLDFFRVVANQALDLRNLLLEQNIRFQNLIRNHRAGSILTRIAEEYRENSPYARMAIIGLLQELFAVLLCQELCTDRQSLSLSYRIRFYKTIEPAVMLLRDRYWEHFPGQMLADACHLNRYHFCRVFKQAMGMTPVQYQNECRLRIADVLLKNSSLNISQIAAQTGFRDEAYFSRAYKKARGVPPSAEKSKLSK